ncbi:protein of unknown function [Acetoanaerobium sticklandii]|uniref:Uncharacterized protein n=1 Tax=Acetoanaerobium sticklandii (strain ATCC 12662 / DSM 519 / JCM 1433 / CCUG 9281 / NCIMB 10654 / HF) TaxID=499177 RepID=E3PY58_ACESD|nr:hypothetical protein [Acetoanaerobium sticklandii]CBH21373.1 protein of unknown function [Acetoanaerobium sticklandii]
MNLELNVMEYVELLREVIENEDKESFIDNILSKYEKTKCVFHLTLSLSHKAEIEQVIKKSDNTSLGLYIQRLVQSKGKRDPIIYMKANLSKDYWNKLINNRIENPSKYRMIRIGLALNLDCEEMNNLLKKAGHSFTNNNKDSLLIWFFDKNIYDINFIDEVMIKYDIEPIFNS